MPRAATELAKEWRTDRALRRLEAMMVVVDAQHTLLVTGTGDVIQPTDGMLGIGSGGNYALAAARALIAHSDLTAAEIVRAALEIAADICIYTNRNIVVEELACEASRVQASRARQNLTPREIVAELDRHIVGQARRQAGRRHRHPQPLAAAAAARRDAARTSRPRTSS